MSPTTLRQQIRTKEPDRNTNQDWPNKDHKPLPRRAHIGKMQTGDQHPDPKQIIDKLDCSHHRHILAIQLALVNDTLQALRLTTCTKHASLYRSLSMLSPATLVVCKLDRLALSTRELL